MNTRGKAESELEVFEDAERWGVRRPGDTRALSHHETREQAERAAELHASVRGGVELRQDIFANDPDQAVRPRRAMLAAAVALAAAALLLIAVSAALALG